MTLAIVNVFPVPVAPSSVALYIHTFDQLLVARLVALGWGAVGRRRAWVLQSQTATAIIAREHNECCGSATRDPAGSFVLPACAGGPELRPSL